MMRPAWCWQWKGEGIRIMAGTAKKLAAVTADALDRALLPEVPLLLMVRSDIAKALGQIIRQKLSGKRPLVAVDAVKAEFNNFVDFGRPISERACHSGDC